MKHNTQLGKKGEQLVCSKLTELGLNIVDTNFNYYSKGRGRKGEIDIIALDSTKCIIHFVEVKSRSSKAFGHPLEQIHYNKIQSMRSTIQYFMVKNQNYKHYNLQIDIASVLNEEVEIIFNAIQLD